MMTPEEKEKLRKDFIDYFCIGKPEYSDHLIDQEVAFNWFLSIMEEREDLFISAGHQLSKALELEKKANKDLEEMDKAHKIELSNYSYQIDSAKRERDKAESENKTLKEKEKELREVNLKFTDIIQSALSTVDIQREEIAVLKKKLEAAENVLSYIPLDKYFNNVYSLNFIRFITGFSIADIESKYEKWKKLSNTITH